MSRGFLCALAGIGMTLLAWFGPWEWPGWPALITMDIVFGARHSFAELPYATRAIVLVLLIVINVAFWGAVVAAAMALWRRAVARSPGS